MAQPQVCLSLHIITLFRQSNNYPSKLSWTSPLIALFQASYPFPVSRNLRSKCLGSSSDRDYLARLCIKTSAPWYEVHLPKDHVCPRAQVACDCKKMGWGYLMRCLASGSMMNRKRIWGIAQQLERAADEMEIWQADWFLPELVSFAATGMRLK